jgi:hypothetical protein
MAGDDGAAVRPSARQTDKDIGYVDRIQNVAPPLFAITRDTPKGKGCCNSNTGIRIKEICGLVAKMATTDQILFSGLWG